MKKLFRITLCLIMLSAFFLLTACSDGGEAEPLTDSQGLVYTETEEGGYSVSFVGEVTPTRVEIPALINGKQVTEIAKNAFNTTYYDVRITELIIPPTVTSIEANAFMGASSIERVYITDLASWCGIEFKTAFSNPLGYAKELYLGEELITELVIPENVTAIPAYAFAYFKGLRSLTVHDGVSAIGERAFASCPSLEIVTIGSGLTDAGDNIFSGCPAIRDLICSSEHNVTKGIINYMETLKFNKNATRVIGHAGLASLETANTCEAFRYAARRSYYGIETDIRKTADGHFVCFHDPNLVDYAGLDITVEGSTLAELRQVVLFDAKKSGTKERGLKIPTLEEYVEICKEYDKECIIELKTPFSSEDVGRIVEIVKSLGYLERSFFISFYYDNMTYVRDHAPDARVAFTFPKLDDEMFNKIVNDRFDVLISTTKITEDVVDRFHAAGREVFCYTVDSVERAEELVSWGIDYIITNRLE